MAIKILPNSVRDGIAAGNDRAREQAKADDRHDHLKSRVVKRSLVVGGHKTSVSLEEVFWNELRAIAHERDLHLSQLAGVIDSQRQHCNLSSAIRLFVFEHRCSRSEDSQQKATSLPNGGGSRDSDRG